MLGLTSIKEKHKQALQAYIKSKQIVNLADLADIADPGSFSTQAGTSPDAFTALVEAAIDLTAPQRALPFCHLLCPVLQALPALILTLSLLLS